MLSKKLLEVLVVVVGHGPDLALPPAKHRAPHPASTLDLFKFGPACRLKPPHSDGYSLLPQPFIFHVAIFSTERLNVQSEAQIPHDAEFYTSQGPLMQADSHQFQRLMAILWVFRPFRGLFRGMRSPANSCKRLSVGDIRRGLSRIFGSEMDENPG